MSTTNWTPARRAKLAAEIGINDKTHPHLCETKYNRDGPYKFLSAYKLPDPTTREGDNVFLAPLLRHLTNLDGEVWFLSIEFVPQTGGGWLCCAEDFAGKDFTCIADSITLALLNAALAAGVPEIVSIIEGE